MFLKGSNIISTSSLCENRMAQSALYVINVVLGELSREKFPLVKLPRGKFPIVNLPLPPFPPIPPHPRIFPRGKLPRIY